jgi:hypothetical protein
MRAAMFLLLAVIASTACAQSGIPMFSITPASPTASDNIVVTARYAPGVAVRSLPSTRVGNVITVSFVQDQVDLIFNIPFAVSVDVGRLAPGHYRFVVSSDNFNFPPPTVQEFGVDVLPAPVPALSRWARVALCTLLALVGALTIGGLPKKRSVTSD